MTKAQQNTERSMASKQFIVTTVCIGVVVLLLAGTIVYLYQENRSYRIDTQTRNKTDTTRVLEKVRAVLLLDETGEPTVARVEDADKLKVSNAEFYRNVAVGDYLIIYPKRIIVYRESNHQIINVAPIVSTEAAAVDGTTSTQ